MDICDFHDQETTLDGRAPSPGTFVSRGRIEHSSGGVGASQQSSTRLTEDRDVDDVARGVPVLFPSRSSPRPLMTRLNVSSASMEPKTKQA